MKAALGPGFKESFALWFVDHAQHDNPRTPLARAHAVSLSGALQQGLRDLALWVEKGVRPPDSAYKMADGQVEIPASARARGGIQPVIDLRVSGGARAEAVVGELVTFTATIEVPPGAGVQRRMGLRRRWRMSRGRRHRRAASAHSALCYPLLFPAQHLFSGSACRIPPGRENPDASRARPEPRPSSGGSEG